MRAGQIFRRYFPVLMLVLLAGVLVCATAYNFTRLGPLMAGGALLLSLLSMFAGMIQAHSFFHEEKEDESFPRPEPDQYVGLLGQASDNFTLASLSALMHEGLALLQHGRIIYANPSLAYILGSQEAELLDTRISSYIHPDDLSILHFENKDQNAPYAGPSRSTLRLNTLLGDTRWVICSVHRTFWQGEELVLLIFEDIGVLKSTQESLEKQEEQSRILLERTPLGIAMFDAMGVLKLSNTAWRSAWKNVISASRRFNILQDPFMPGSSVEKTVRQAFNRQESSVKNYEYNTSWGETRWLNLNFHPMLTPLDQLIGVIMMQHDITDSIRSARRENELNDQLISLRLDVDQARLELIRTMDKSGNVLVCFDENGLVTLWNNRAEERFNLPRKRALGCLCTLPMLGLYAFLPLLEKARSNPAERGGVIKGRITRRLDSFGPHYERAEVSILRMGMKNAFILVVRDMTGELFAGSMSSLLAGLDSLERTRLLFSSLLDFSSAPPRLKTGPENENLLARLAEAPPPVSEYPLPLPGRNSGIRAEDLLNGLKEHILERHESLSVLVEAASPEAILDADPSRFVRVLAELADLLLRGRPSGGEAELRIFQGLEEDRALINLFFPAALPEKLPLPEIWRIFGKPDARAGITEILGGPDHPEFPARPLREIEALRGIAGLYLDSRSKGAGAVCRIPLLQDSSGSVRRE